MRAVLFQLVSLAGAFLILIAYLAINRKWMGPDHRLYNLLNLMGGVLLLWVAVVDQRIGFVVLEATWALVAIPPLFRKLEPTRTNQSNGREIHDPPL
jgi:Na+-translocating ferredoxin:NAD+ oxidoreductase RnfD subunit